MTTNDPTSDDAGQLERERAVEALTEALAADEPDEKDYQIREAIQLLALTGD